MTVTIFNSNGLMDVRAICEPGERARVVVGFQEYTRAEADRLAQDIRKAAEAVERHNRPHHKWGEH